MSISDMYVGQIYSGGNKNTHRKVKDMNYRNNKWLITYRNCGYTDKQGWYEFGDIKLCSRKTFNAWIKDEVII